MKRLFLLFITVSLCVLNGNTQPSQGINYQAVARDNFGKELQNQELEVRFSILEIGLTNKTTVWEETHTLSTNKFGLFTAIIGQGFKTMGPEKLSDIDWGTYSHSLKVDIKTGEAFSPMGETPMTFIPYALYALKSGNGGSGSSNISYDPETSKLYADSKEVANLSNLKDDVSNTIEDLKLDGNNLTITVKDGEKFTADLSQFKDNTDDQTLSISGQQLKLSKKDGSVSEVPLPKQILSVEQNNILKLSSDGGSVTYDPSPLNEIQQISIKGDSLIIYRPSEPRPDGSVKLPDLYEKNDTIYLDGFSTPYKVSLRNDLTVLPNNKLSIFRGNTVNIDTDPTNEIQDLSLSNDILKITNSTSAKEIDLTPYKDNTDNQTLSYNPVDTSIVIDNGNKLNVANMVNVPWEGFSAKDLDKSINPGASSFVLWSTEFSTPNAFIDKYFNAPSTGFYTFSINIYSDRPFAIKIFKNDNSEIRNISIDGVTFSHTLLIPLLSTDKISVQIINYNPSNVLKYSGYISGYRVH